MWCMCIINDIANAIACMHIKIQKTENKEKESSWLPSFIKRSRHSEPNIAKARKHSGPVQPVHLAAATATNVVTPQSDGDNAFSKRILDRRLSRPLTTLFTVGECIPTDQPRMVEQTNCLR